MSLTDETTLRSRARSFCFFVFALVFTLAETGYCGYGDTCKFLHDRGTCAYSPRLDSCLSVCLCHGCTDDMTSVSLPQTSKAGSWTSSPRTRGGTPRRSQTLARTRTTRTSRSRASSAASRTRTRSRRAARTTSARLAQSSGSPGRPSARRAARPRAGSSTGRTR